MRTANTLVSGLRHLVARGLRTKHPALCVITGHWYRKWHYRALYEQFQRTCERCGKVRKADPTSAEKRLGRFIADHTGPSVNRQLDPTVGLVGE